LLPRVWPAQDIVNYPRRTGLLSTLRDARTARIRPLQRHAIGDPAVLLPVRVSTAICFSLHVRERSENGDRIDPGAVWPRRHRNAGIGIASVLPLSMRFAPPRFFASGSETAPIRTYMGNLPSQSAFPRTWPPPNLTMGGGSFRSQPLLTDQRPSKTSSPMVPGGRARGSTDEVGIAGVSRLRCGL
jgi:hypothetical protein